METNVIPGDRAIIVNSRVPENIGVVVDVVREYTGGPLGSMTECETLPGVTWVVESLGRKIIKVGRRTGTRFHEQVTAMHDSCLRPLRDSDGVDHISLRRVEEPA